MNRISTFHPNWASKPGDTISDILKDRKLSIGSFAEKINYSKRETNDLIEGQLEINHEIACKLEMVLGASKDFWLNREFNYRKDLSRIEEEKSWLKELPLKSMREFGWINQSNNILTDCLNFFDVPDVNTWRKRYSDLYSQYSFRISNSYTSEVGAVATWIRQGEIQASNIECKKWSKEVFIDTLEEIKPLTKRKSPKDFLPTLIKSCADCGVAVTIVQTPSGCRASGATKFINEDKALLLLSFRYLSDDQFWFTFFHEAGHILYHGERGLFIEGMPESKIEEEREANIFAGEILIPHHLEEELSKLRGNKRDIISFAIKAGISPGIVVGQLQHRGYFQKSSLNAFKRRYDREEINSIVRDFIR